MDALKTLLSMLLLLCVLFVVISCLGCSQLLTDPGGQTREALEGRHSVIVDPNKMEMVDQTPQGGTVIYAESQSEEGLTVTPGETETSPPTVGKANIVYYRQMQPDKAAEAFGAAVIESAKMHKEAMIAYKETMHEAMGVIRSLLPGGGGSSPVVVEPSNGGSRPIERVVERFQSMDDAEKRNILKLMGLGDYAALLGVGSDR